jgi:hypothetical protein
MKLYFYVLSMSGPAEIVESDLSAAERAEWKAITADYDAEPASDEMESDSGAALQVTSRLDFSNSRRGASVM